MKKRTKGTQSRRSCLKRSALGSGIAFLPSYLTAARKPGDRLPPSERINLGCVGVGGRGSNVIRSLAGSGAQPAAFCDLDFELPRAVKSVVKAYPDVPRFNDFRVMLETMDKDIDAVSVAIPDHSHFPAAILAMSMGKHVYVEKPLTRTFEESEILMRAEKKYGVVTQMGNQGHTGNGINLFSKMVDMGLCDGITRMAAWKTPGLWFMKKNERISLPLVKGTVPASLNTYDLWCGPRRKLPYNDLYHPFNWRGFYEYGMGMLGDWGAHIVDFPHDKLDMGLPTVIKAIHMEDHNKIFYPLESYLSMHFPARGKNRPAIDMTWHDGPNCWPEVPKQFWEKDQNGKPLRPRLNGGGTLLYSDEGDLAILRGNHADIPRLIPRDQHIRYYDELKEGSKADKGSGKHFSSFVRACKGEGQTNSPFSISGKLSQVLALGTIGQYMNTELEFDPVKKQFIGNDEANLLLNPPARAGWEEFYKMA
ncbi:Gfo/Idh/MocA family oxidoreductase [Verrucomicrobia bacterium S94]|nr:Gfo/Idh/MocA family oxidoreductase [Verrucomicrobia bacterium S94]